MTTENKKEKDIIDLGEIFKTLMAKKKTFFIMWPIVFVLSCLWIFPQPRYYNCEVSLAPETTGEGAGGLAGIASSFGINIGGGGNDAIYPMLYPDLMESNEFIVDLMNIKVKTEDGTVNTDYYTYLKKYQEKNGLTRPFELCINYVSGLFKKKEQDNIQNAENLNPFLLSERDFKILEGVKKNITCSVDKKTEVITINVIDQDRLITATLADSVRLRLQKFITEYRTKKTRIDLEHYQELVNNASAEYHSAVNEYAEFCDANQDIILQSQQSKRDELENDMQMRYNTYQALQTQLEALKAKLQERTPAFTTLKSATVPIKPAGPKRMLFVISMLVISTLVTSIWLCRGMSKEK